MHTHTQDTIQIKFFVTGEDGVQREIDLLQHASGNGKVSALIRNQFIGEIKLHKLLHWQDYKSEDQTRRSLR